MAVDSFKDCERNLNFMNLSPMSRTPSEIFSSIREYFQLLFAFQSVWWMIRFPGPLFSSAFKAGMELGEAGKGALVQQLSWCGFSHPLQRLLLSALSFVMKKFLSFNITIKVLLAIRALVAQAGTMFKHIIAVCSYLRWQLWPWLLLKAINWVSLRVPRSFRLMGLKIPF